MAVFTVPNEDAVRVFAAAYGIGEVRACTGIAEGYENSNFLLVTATGRFILTLYEKRVKEEDLPFFLGLMAHLADRGIPCPRPLRRRDGAVFGRLADRPAAILSFLAGAWPRRVTERHCRALGRSMARMHRAGRDFPIERAPDLSLGAWRGLARRLAGRAEALQPGLEDLIAAELDFLEAHWPDALPGGVIHGDLFPDNVFFARGRISGLIDFYFACQDRLAFDLAVCLNAWCCDGRGRMIRKRAAGLLAGYGEERRLEKAEVAALPTLARGAALRFLLTRLEDWLAPAPGLVAIRKDPREYLARLRHHQNRDWDWLE
jgi:homoserine kinase type II